MPGGLLGWCGWAQRRQALTGLSGLAARIFIGRDDDDMRPVHRWAGRVRAPPQGRDGAGGCEGGHPRGAEEEGQDAEGERDVPDVHQSG